MTNTTRNILIVLGVLAVIIIIFNWNKIFGKKNGTTIGTTPNTGTDTQRFDSNGNSVNSSGNRSICPKECLVPSPSNPGLYNCKCSPRPSF